MGSPTYAAIPKLRGERNMPVSLWPAFATFVDLNAAQSVRVVEPARMAEFFGQGVSIRSVSLEITGEPVTGGTVQSHLPWIGNIKGVLIPAPPKSDGDYSPEERIRGLNFRRDV